MVYRTGYPLEDPVMGAVFNKQHVWRQLYNIAAQVSPAPGYNRSDSGVLDCLQQKLCYVVWVI